MNGWMWLPAEAEATYRGAPRSNGVANWARNRPGRPAWADRPRPILAQYDPVLLPDASRSIVDLLPSHVGPWCRILHSLDRAPCCVSFDIFGSGPWSFMSSCFGPWSFGVMFMMCLDLCRASWSSLKVLGELIPKVSSLTLVSYINNKLQNRHARVNLIPRGVSIIS
jgi:hypothetical protein